MQPHWENVVDTFEALSYILKYVDPNGLDLFFADCTDCLRDCKRTKTMIQLVKSRRENLRGVTDITIKLTEILDDYKSKLEKSKSIFRSATRPLNLYVLTDGVWEEDCNAGEPIRRLVNKLTELGKAGSQVGIEFISFGNHPIALARLDHLDSGLDLKP